MAVIHHVELGVESTVPDSTVHIWERSGWKPGPLKKPRRSSQALPAEVASPPADESPAPESGDSTTPDLEV